MMTKTDFAKLFKPVVLGLCLIGSVQNLAAAQSPYSEPLSDSEVRLAKSIITRCEPFVEQAKKEGRAALLDWETLYAPLNIEQRAFIDSLRAAETFDTPPAAKLVAIPARTLKTAEGDLDLGIQYLPTHTLMAYEQMMQAMQADIGKRLLVESGHRSPAYQAYLFVYYLKNHNFSIEETRRFVALPGTSEHGDIRKQAIDFITVDGVNGDGNPEAFEATLEFKWLMQNANHFGFILSYPQETASSAYEPWHWHHNSQAAL